MAIKRADAEGATVTAGGAIAAFSEFNAQTAELGPGQPSLEEGWSAVVEAIESECQRWLAWSEGRNHPTPGDAEVYFAFRCIPIRGA